MKITRITIDNLIGVSHIDVDLPTPIAIFAGANHAGKSSVREAIRAALMGMPERVLKKKDLHQLVHGQAKGGGAAVTVAGGAQATFAAPSGKQVATKLSVPEVLAMPYCLESAAFAAASADDRRQMLFALTGASSSKADIVAAMRERGLTDSVIEAVTPRLAAAGFPAAAKFAEERCRDLKADWKATTGETYGPVKADTWAAEVPTVDTTALEQLKTRVEILKGKIATGRTQLGAAEQKLKTWQAAQESRAADEKAYAALQSCQDKLARDEAELARWTEQVHQLELRAGTGPRVGLVHDLAAVLTDVLGACDVPDDLLAVGNRHLAAYESEHGPLGAQGDPEAAEKLPEARKARALMQSCVDNDHRDIKLAESAGARLQQEIEKGSEAVVQALRESLREADQELATSSADLASLQRQQQAADQALGRTTVAAATHREIQAWQAAIDALSSDGIPAEILLKSLGPVNRILAGLATTLNFPRVTITGADIDIYAGDRPYALLSASERWRADAQIALALAELSGLKMVAFDGFDILDLAGRADCITGLDDLANAGKIDTALVFGTFKKLPGLGSFEHVSGYWVEDGQITETTAAVETAAA